MKNPDQFFIGWQGEIPEGHRKLIIKSIILLITVFVSVPVFYTLSEKGFINSHYEYGNITEHQGILFMQPEPVLRVQQPNGIPKEIMLIGAGKFGAKPTLKQWEQENRQPLNGKEVTLRGTLIYYDDFSLLELTEGIAAIAEVRESTTIIQQHFTKQRHETLIGEIIDVKCFFGAMNPGEGKIHKSCGIRCISAGIPAGFKTINGKYYVLEFDGNLSFSALKNFTGQGIQIEGNSYKSEGINYLKVENKPLIEIMTQLHINFDITSCASKSTIINRKQL